MKQIFEIMKLTIKYKFSAFHSFLYRSINIIMDRCYKEN